MAARAPRVDPRTYDALLQATKDAIRSELSLAHGAAVPGEALAEIFARLAEIVVEHINRVPEKNLFAFLSMLGLQRDRPRPARVPLTFALAAGASAVRLPAGSTAAALPVSGEVDPPVYETELELEVTPTALVDAYVREPALDRYRAASAIIAGSGGVPAFEANTPIAHELYVADDLLALPQPKDVTLRIGPRDAALRWPTELSWSFFDGTSWKSRSPTLGGAGDDPWVLSFKGLPGVVPTAIGGEVRPWLRAALGTPLPAPPAADVAAKAGRVAQSALTPDAMAAGAARLDVHWPFAPFGIAAQPAVFAIACERAFTKPGALATLTIAVDPAHHTVASDDLQLAWKAAGSQAALVVHTSPQEQAKAFCEGGTITFDVPDGRQTTKIGGVQAHWLTVTVVKGTFKAGSPFVRSLTVAYDWPLPVVTSLTREVHIARSALAPDRMCLNGRAIAPGDGMLPFGTTPAVGDAFYVACDEALSLPGAAVTLTVKTPAKTPPSQPTVAWEMFDGSAWIQVAKDKTATTVTKSVQLTVPGKPAPVTVGGERHAWLRARVLTVAAAPAPTVTTEVTGSKTVTTVQVAATPPPSIDALTIGYTFASSPAPVHALAKSNDFTTVLHASLPVTPFVAGDDRSPTLYIAFDGTFENAATCLFLDVDEQSAGGDVPRRVWAGSPPVVSWEYRGANGWAALGVRDETRGLTARGLVRFIAPVDMARSREFEVDAYWLRVRWESGSYRARPRLRRVLTNTIWATSSQTIRDEILGSSSGMPSQRFRIARLPVLAGERIEVREPSWYARGEQATIEAADPGAGVAPPQTWVAWQGVADFCESGPLDRHYVIDPLSGTIDFGDGLRGLVPPAGEGNVRASSYRSGGGAAGNRPAGAITQLRSAVPSITGVRNELPARGGTDAQPLEAVRERGPRTLRHRDRAVTAQDVHDLAMEASRDVARVHVVSAGAAGDAGEIGVVVVPASEERPPVPDIELLARVREHLRARLPAGASLWVAGPGWLRIAITAEVVASDVAAGSDLRAAIRARLDEFLDPVSATPERPAWAFGRAPRRSDVFSVIHSVPGVAHVRALSLASAAVVSQPVAGTQLVFAGDHTIALTGAGDEG